MSEAGDIIAAIDCGTNTMKLLIGHFQQRAHGLVLHEELERESHMVRLGQGVDTTGELSAEALSRAFAAVDHFAELIDGYEVDRIRFCATSATRDASNAAVFSDGVLARLGVRPEVLSGLEEAELTYLGAVRNLVHEPAAPALVIDIGGGSTELVVGAGAQVQVAASMDVGSVRLHERRLHSDPPERDEIAACVADIEAALDAAEAAGVVLSQAQSVIGVAGTITSIAAGVLGLESYDADAIDQRTIGVTAVHEFVAELVAMTTKQRLAIGWMHPGRADVIGAGALILDRVLARTNVSSLVVSESDILDGIAWSAAEDD